MKILHVCLSGYFSEGWSYQDNLIVKAHASMGHDVFVFASQYYRDRLSVRRTKRTNYKTVEGATIYRFSYRYDRLPLSINSEFRLYKHIEETLYEINNLERQIEEKEEEIERLRSVDDEFGMLKEQYEELLKEIQ